LNPIVTIGDKNFLNEGTTNGDYYIDKIPKGEISFSVSTQDSFENLFDLYDFIYLEKKYLQM
jgi:hypothetical protein